MDKLTMCRICLVENVRMYVVVDKNIHELYEKLTDIPFVTEDSRPMLSCVFCYAKLKQCCQMQRKCLAAEELLAQMINEPNPSITRGPLEYCNGLMKTPIQSLSIVDDSQIDSITIKEELPAACDGQDGAVEPKQENPQDDGELEYVTIFYDYSDEEHIPLQDSKSDGDKVPLVEFKTEEEEVQEVSRKRRASGTRSVPAAKKPNPDPQKDNSDHSLTPKHKNKGQEHSKTSENTKQFTKITTSSVSLCLVHTGDKPYKCDVCQSSFSEKSKLKTHICTHSGEKPFKCDICRSSFSRKGYLTKHIRTHTGERPHKCHICQRSFTVKGNLRKHIFTHTGEKPYKCHICQISFGEKSNLTRHISRHIGGKPYKCEICQSSFGRNSDLKKHIRTHTGEKPYQCDICQSSFSQKCNLKTHIRLHTGEKPYRCDKCPKRYPDRSSLRYHVLKHH